ncbi:MAG: hypothetical protein MZW92_31250 [Comamonadaceae bacterium]|nr:hypothetical protein [Comamonadaceae bacterium]
MFYKRKLLHTLLDGSNEVLQKRRKMSVRRTASVAKSKGSPKLSFRETVRLPKIAATLIYVSDANAAYAPSRIDWFGAKDAQSPHQH